MDTSDLYLHYAHLSREGEEQYGTIDAVDYDDMKENSNKFMEATYPVENVVTQGDLGKITGNNNTGSSDPYYDIRNDVLKVIQLAGLTGGKNSIAVAMGPKNENLEYVNYHTYRRLKKGI